MKLLLNSELGIDTAEDLQNLKNELFALLDDAKQGKCPMTDDEYFIPIGLLAHTVQIANLMEADKEEEALEMTEAMAAQMDKLDEIFNDQI